jgi:para-nitrobenzyl esterase
VLALLALLALCVAPVGGLRHFSLLKTSAPKDRPSMVLQSGPVVGEWVDSSAGARVARFLAIPFAASTAGAGRWRPPAPVAPWKQPLDATKVGPACAQAQPQGDPDGALFAQRAHSCVHTPPCFAA